MLGDQGPPPPLGPGFGAAEFCHSYFVIGGGGGGWGMDPVDRPTDAQPPTDDRHVRTDVWIPWASAVRGACTEGARPASPPGMHWKGREWALQAAPEAVRQAVGGDSQSGWGRLLPVTHAVEPGTWGQGDSGWA